MSATPSFYPPSPDLVPEELTRVSGAFRLRAMFLVGFVILFACHGKPITPNQFQIFERFLGRAVELHERNIANAAVKSGFVRFRVGAALVDGV